ncbi:hypothetical protein SARC_12201 [Sphaeroforma arctica JP610]|uniref:Uncharacterized protein n=1 Tax=Sphaeroforma arctica JP610 TaxID=667725 RepID=A0A0L0FFL8_9EUKA|nr:hypothetical protein SARC_12201 [Sphaeroforma arctica JP610]KNC75271.1 hypothetical protein SARC_12201 [Sphaeroforma arctica JP610]|eukprot:XP_014149173.1 hypothetical protein SARC_12201 [Sphaeroforma arctica JP610]
MGKFNCGRCQKETSKLIGKPDFCKTCGNYNPEVSRSSISSSDEEEREKIEEAFISAHPNIEKLHKRRLRMKK